MRFTKKILGLFVIFTLLSSICTSYAYAASSAPLTLGLNNVSCRQGDHAFIELSIQNVPSKGISSFIINVDYDKTKLKFDSLRPTELIYDASNDIAVVQTKSGLKIMYADDSQTGDSYIKSSGILGSINFTALADSGIVPLTLKRQSQKDRDNKGNDPLKKANLVNGSVEIKGAELYGDANNDNVVDSADYTLLTRYLRGILSPDATFLKRMDVNADSSVDMADSVLLKYFLVGKLEQFPAGVYVEEKTEPEVEPIISEQVDIGCGLMRFTGKLTENASAENKYRITTAEAVWSLEGNVDRMNLYVGENVTIIGAPINKQDLVTGEPCMRVRVYQIYLDDISTHISRPGFVYVVCGLERFTGELTVNAAGENKYRVIVGDTVLSLEGNTDGLERYEGMNQQVTFIASPINKRDAVTGECCMEVVEYMAVRPE